MSETKKHREELLKDFLKYDEKTGLFFWIKKPAITAKIGGTVGSKNKFGYVTILFKGKTYYAHRLAWMFTYGKWPDKDIDHINGIRHDNRICNLRDVSRRENLGNMKKHRSGGLVGTSFHKTAKKWVSRVYINKKLIHLGHFKTEQEAHEVYLKAVDNLESKYGDV